ncbi:hypothetical protein GCM10027299_09250 [Larkinella ripae]
MYHLISKSSPLFRKLGGLQRRIQAAHVEARKVAVEMGADPGYLLLGTGYAAGMLEGLHFAKRPGDWKLVHQEGSVSLYYPKDLLRTYSERRQLQKGPCVDRIELGEVIGYLPNPPGSLMRLQPFVGFSWYPNYILVHIPQNAFYTPIEGMESIDPARYDALYRINSTTIPVHKWGKNDRILIRTA